MDSWLVMVANGKSGTISSFDYTAGTLRELVVNQIGADGMPLVVDAARKLLFVGTVEPYAIRTLRIDPTSGELSEMAMVEAAGNPVHLSLSADGRWLAMASYHDGLGQLFAVADDGSLRPVGELVHHRNLHSGALSDDGRQVYFVSLRDDLVACYAIDDDGTLTPLETPTAPAPAGSGPRHLVFNTDQSQLYVNTEYSGEVVRYRRDPATGVLSVLDETVNVPTDLGLTHSRFGADPRAEELIWGSELRLGVGGSRLYSAERTRATITAQPIASDGSVGAPTAHSGVVPQPRGFAVLPDQNLLVASEITPVVALYRPDSAGSLQLLQEAEVGAGAVWIGVLPR